MSIDVKYLTTVTAVGGRNGVVLSEDDTLKLTLSTPVELGGTGGEGTNPEQLFAAGYSACFLSALRAAGHRQKVDVPFDTSVTAVVGIGMNTKGGFGLVIDLLVTAPGLDRSAAEQLAAAAHQLCPYSNATRNNVDVTLNIA